MAFDPSNNEMHCAVWQQLQGLKIWGYYAPANIKSLGPHPTNWNFALIIRKFVLDFSSGVDILVVTYTAQAKLLAIGRKKCEKYFYSTT
jgi:hypothetical protein